MAAETKEEKHLRLAFKHNVERLMKDAALMLLHKHWPGCAQSSILAMEQTSEYFHRWMELRNPQLTGDMEDTFKNDHQRRLLQGLLLSSTGKPADFGVGDEYVDCKQREPKRCVKGVRRWRSMWTETKLSRREVARTGARDQRGNGPQFLCGGASLLQCFRQRGLRRGTDESGLPVME